ncbi:MAG: hypothetical protein ABJE47_01475 [bacterium]
MRRSLGMLLVMGALGCSASLTSPSGPEPIVTTDGPLKLSVVDAPAQPGVLFIAAAVTGGATSVTVKSTRYGSMCSTAVTAHADVVGNQVTLHVTYAERLTICTADVRAVSYTANIGGLTIGNYDVHVVHTNPDGSTSTVLTQRVAVIPLD